MLTWAYQSVDCQSKPQSEYPYCNSDLSINERVEDLVSRMTLEELVNQTGRAAPAIPHLGMKDYNWRSNCLHGWTASGGKFYNYTWNTFPGPIGLGATFDLSIIKKLGSVTADEGRALHNILLHKNNGSSLEALSLNCFSPNVNLFRDPRWGRGQETFGEDPYLIAMIGAAYTEGLQEKKGKYYKMAACAKHIAVHSGPEKNRLSFVANATEHDLYDTYFPQFETQARCVNVLQMMPAYSGIRSKESPKGAPCAANEFLLKELVRSRWNRSDISMMSDNRAIKAVYTDHHYASSMQQAVGMCMNATTDIDLGGDHVYPNNIIPAIEHNLVNKKDVIDAVKRSMRLRMLVGDFDSPDKVPFASYGEEHLNTDYNKKINLIAAQKSIVLTRNRNHILPLNTNKYPRIGLVGNNANNSKAYLSNYEGIPDHIYTVYESLFSYAKKNSLPTPKYAPGCNDSKCTGRKYFPKALDIANDVDIIIAVMGLDMTLEGEDHDRTAQLCNGTETALMGLPGCQSQLLYELKQLGKEIILVLVHGASIAIPDFIDTSIDAFYPGQFGGQAIIDVLMGDYNPAGKLPYTIIKDDSGLPNQDDYDITAAPGRTYKYFVGEVQFPFGYGLSYSNFSYSEQSFSSTLIHACDSFTLSIHITNLGPYDGEEVVQVYITSPNTTFIVPKRQLMGFKRVSIKNQETILFTYTIDPIMYSVVNMEGKRVLLNGQYEIYVGGGQPGFSSGLSHSFIVDNDHSILLDECSSDVQKYFCMDFTSLQQFELS
ncbi:hypothetical protein WA158_005329 [Blastocystis sp. Blastoise]